MAHTDMQWERAKFLYEIGESLREIEKYCGISDSQVSKRANKENWKREAEKQELKSEIIGVEQKKEALKKEQAMVMSKVAKLQNFEITILSEKIMEEMGIESFIFNTQVLAIIRNNEMLTRGTKSVMLKTRQFSDDGTPVGEEFNAYEVPIDATDIKNIVDSVDKASITLKVSDRHASKKEVTNQEKPIDLMEFVKKRWLAMEQKRINGSLAQNVREVPDD